MTGQEHSATTMRAIYDMEASVGPNDRLIEEQHKASRYPISGEPYNYAGDNPLNYGDAVGLLWTPVKVREIGYETCAKTGIGIVGTSRAGDLTTAELRLVEGKCRTVDARERLEW